MRFNPPMKLHLRGRETNRIEDSLGGRWEGLLAVKQRYDPRNFSASIRPSAGETRPARRRV